MSAHDDDAAIALPASQRLSLLLFVRLATAAVFAASMHQEVGTLKDVGTTAPFFLGLYVAAVVAMDFWSRRRLSNRLDPFTFVEGTLDAVFVFGMTILAGTTSTEATSLGGAFVVATALCTNPRRGTEAFVCQAAGLGALVEMGHYRPVLPSLIHFRPETLPLPWLFVSCSWITAIAVVLLATGLAQIRRRRDPSTLPALLELSTALDSATNRVQVLQRLTGSLAKSLDSRKVAMVYPSANGVTVLDSGGRKRELRDLKLKTLGGALEAATVQRAVVSTRWASSSQDASLSKVMPNCSAAIILPLRVDDDVVALAICQIPARHPIFSRSQILLATNLASRAALSYRNLMLLDEIRHLAHYDTLTTLYNRRSFDEALKREVSRSQRDREPLCLVLLDIDHFKRVNDNYGHQAGDEVLRSVGRAIKTACREIDIPARYGGEEIAVLLPRCSIKEAREVAERLREAIKREVTVVPVTASAGVASYPHHARGGDDLVSAADKALYKAKENGRDQAIMAPPLEL